MYVTSQRIQDFLEAFLVVFFSVKNEIFSGEQEKESIICVKIKQKNPLPLDHHLSSLSKHHDANR